MQPELHATVQLPLNLLANIWAFYKSRAGRAPDTRYSPWRRALGHLETAITDNWDMHECPESLREVCTVFPHTLLLQSNISIKPGPFINYAVMWYLYSAGILREAGFALKSRSGNFCNFLKGQKWTAWVFSLVLSARSKNMMTDILAGDRNHVGPPVYASKAAVPRAQLKLGL